MSGKDWLDDYMEYKLSSGESDEESGGSANSGCLPCILGVLFAAWLISLLFS